MHPSSPSNADAPGRTDYHVATRALTADLSAARTDESARDLGPVGAPALRALLEKLLALDPAEAAEADPQLVVTGRRGRFVVRPGRGRVLLRPATGAAGDYCELAVDDVPGFLDGRDAVAAPAEEAAGAPAAVPPPAETRLALAIALFVVAGLLVAGSAWFTFRPDDFDPAADYAAVAAPAEAAAVRQGAAGTYVSGSGDDERVLEIETDGRVRYREYGPERALADERTGTATVARRRADQMTVLRVADLGTIEVRNPDTLVFARDTYQRRGAGGGRP